MDNALDVLFFKERVQRGAVADVQLVKFRLGMHRGAEARLQIVRHYHFPARSDKLINSVGADISRSAKYQNSHVTLLAAFAIHIIYRLRRFFNTFLIGQNAGGEALRPRPQGYQYSSMLRGVRFMPVIKETLPSSCSMKAS